MPSARGRSPTGQSPPASMLQDRRSRRSAPRPEPPSRRAAAATAAGRCAPTGTGATGDRLATTRCLRRALGAAARRRPWRLGGCRAISPDAARKGILRRAGLPGAARSTSRDTETAAARRRAGRGRMNAPATVTAPLIRWALAASPALTAFERRFLRSLADRVGDAGELRLTARQAVIWRDVAGKASRWHSRSVAA